ncbi:SPAG7 protein, partial [Acromyrmex insinuator]
MDLLGSILKSMDKPPSINEKQKALMKKQREEFQKCQKARSHDVAEVANILAYSFGEEGVDRYIMIFKKEHAPSEDQLNTLRKGEEWNEEVAKRLKEERERKAKEESEYAKSRKRKENFVPNSYYKDKYQHLIGKEAALEAARKTEANSSYGCVPSENKKDQRSIEQTLADIRAKKRRLEMNNETNNCSDNSTK